ncbi:RepFIB replication protein A (plasmid) [Piscirickettsia salmonis]|uniref:plasmid replication initiator TrfA n=1 Tax=Piscirickettsia salmonis TaxID=1238 RepID=UPI0012BA8BA2|nr:plasmid replication initiator TrfA [Piscirickettsia salmonis]QGP56639.1 TrfA protein [Piscirickettsia salmonis]QGP61445.1 RepFIB replication protein A [Piscirickettsia salmonis]QGP61458.1 TrfA protein [Piscirickettsia salmonis]QGP66211.1 RepFIB replication protein A [Piscirickettsia salmonis]
MKKASDINSSLAQRISSISNKKSTTFNDKTSQALMSSSEKEVIIPFPKNHPVNKFIVPVSILRSALFGLVRRGARKEFKVDSQTLKGQPIAAWTGCEIRYSGYQLDQADLDTWMCCLEMVKQHGFGAVVYVRPIDFLKKMGKKKSQSAYQWLQKSVRRLQLADLQIENAKSLYSGHLIDSFYYDKEIDKYALKIDSDLSKLFEHGYTALEKATRQQLKGDLAKWLFGYAYSHKTSDKPHQISLEKIQNLCGSESPARNFKISLSNAVEQLKNLNLIEGRIADNKLYMIKKSNSSEISNAKR